MNSRFCIFAARTWKHWVDCSNSPITYQAKTYQINIYPSCTNLTSNIHPSYDSSTTHTYNMYKQYTDLSHPLRILPPRVLFKSSDRLNIPSERISCRKYKLHHSISYLINKLHQKDLKLEWSQITETLKFERNLESISTRLNQKLDWSNWLEVSKFKPPELGSWIIWESEFSSLN